MPQMFSTLSSFIWKQINEIAVFYFLLNAPYCVKATTMIGDLQKQMFLSQFNNQMISKIPNNLARLKDSVDSLSVLTVLVHLFVCLLKDRMSHEASFCENGRQGPGRQGGSDTDNAQKQWISHTGTSYSFQTERKPAALTALSKLSPHISILEAEGVCKSPCLWSVFSWLTVV